MKVNKIVALVPMRHHSQRIPGKNYRELAGKPLFHHILDTLTKCQEITEIVVDTDSPNIMESIKKDFPKILVIERPENLRSDNVPMNEILLYDTSRSPADYYLQTHATNPLLSAGTISTAIQTFFSVYPSFDSLFSVTRIQSRLWDGLARPINHNPAILLQTQDLPPMYEENSCIYLFNRPILELHRNRIGERPYLFEISPGEAWDIDEEDDFKLVELIMKLHAGHTLV